MRGELRRLLSNLPGPLPPAALDALGRGDEPVAFSATLAALEQVCVRRMHRTDAAACAVSRGVHFSALCCPCMSHGVLHFGPSIACMLQYCLLGVEQGPCRILPPCCRACSARGQLLTPPPRPPRHSRPRSHPPCRCKPPNPKRSRCGCQCARCLNPLSSTAAPTAPARCATGRLRAPSSWVSGGARRARAAASHVASCPC